MKSVKIINFDREIRPLIEGVSKDLEKYLDPIEDGDQLQGEISKYLSSLGWRELCNVDDNIGLQDLIAELDYIKAISIEEDSVVWVKE